MGGWSPSGLHYKDKPFPICQRFYLFHQVAQPQKQSHLEFAIMDFGDTHSTAFSESLECTSTLAQNALFLGNEIPPFNWPSTLSEPYLFEWSACHHLEVTREIEWMDKDDTTSLPTSQEAAIFDGEVDSDCNAVDWTSDQVPAGHSCGQSTFDLGYSRAPVIIPGFESLREPRPCVLKDLPLRIGSPCPSNISISTSQRDSKILSGCSFTEVEAILCNWPRCLKLVPMQEQEVHKRAHAQQLLSNWMPGTSCAWVGCTSKAGRNNFKLFQKHLETMHINPIQICTVPNCSHPGPFRGRHDLQRHNETVHRKTKHRCPYQTCRPPTNEFSRGDKLMEHLKYYHIREPCPYDHCKHKKSYEFTSKTTRHIVKEHDQYECRLRNCHGTFSGFTQNTLLEHLATDHSMEWESIFKAGENIKSAGDFVMRAEHLPGGDSMALMCNSCNFDSLRKNTLETQS
ncbi:hypothetical protein B0O99DRAFT_621412 [Bisporella sp. PMI_857]|nr:hypothetical protein B0O99DRAFT_621412 [Bisporella sp. PMI_857]